MTVYEIVYMLNETSNLIGQMLFDMVSVIFAILAAGFILGNKLNKTMIMTIAVLSAIWVMPMLAAANTQFGVLRRLASQLSPEELGSLGDLVFYTGSESILMSEALATLIIIAHLGTYLASIWFLFYSSKRPGQLS